MAGSSTCGFLKIDAAARIFFLERSVESMKESSICQIVEGTEFTKSSRGESGMRTLQISEKHSFPVEAMAKLLTRRAILLCDVLLWPWPSKFSVLRKNATLTEAKPVAKSEAKSGPRDMKM